MTEVIFNQSGAELKIQDDGAHESKCGHVGQPRWRTWIGLADFHGDTNHARVTQKSILTMSCHPKQQKSVRQKVMVNTKRLGFDCSLDGWYRAWRDDYVIGNQNL